MDWSPPNVVDFEVLINENPQIGPHLPSTVDVVDVLAALIALILLYLAEVDTENFSMAKADPDQNENMSRFDFRISAYTPTTFPLGRLGQYMSELANLLGEETVVRFAGTKEGSTTVSASVEREYAHRIEYRLRIVGSPDAPSKLKGPYREINKLLRKDRAYGTLSREGYGQIIEFPGCNMPTSECIGPIREHGALDGKLVRVGGRDKTIHALLVDADGREYKLVTANIDLAKQLAAHIFSLVRVIGVGVWNRNQERQWELKEFTIEGFEPLEKRTLIEAVTELRAIEGSEWQNMEDPLAVLLDLRRD